MTSSGVLISTDPIEECCERGIRLSFLTPGGRPYAMLTSPMLTATALKEANLAACRESDKAVEGLERLRREALRGEGEWVDDIRGSLMGIEGHPLPQDRLRTSSRR